MSCRLGCAVLVVAGSCLAQNAEEQLQTAIRHVRYLPLAEAARVQGDVHLKLAAGSITVLSGPPLLAQAASEDTKSFATLLGNGEFDLTYHFGFVNTVRSTPTVLKKGNAVKRAMLYLLGRKTKEVVLMCDAGVAPPSDVRISGPILEIRVYGREFCVRPESETVIAKR